jgi:hypothetical protein
MDEAGIWVTRAERLPRAHQPRNRRPCFGKLVQIDGSPPAWFEARWPVCNLLFYVDGANRSPLSTTSPRLRAMRAGSESRWRIYSDKHSLFRVARPGPSGRQGLTQFCRALDALNIDISCANSPQAKGRVERMNKTLQDRLVKELRLAGVSNGEAGNAFAPEYMEDYNRRFARAPANSHDAHRPLQDGEDLSCILTWQEDRTLSRNLTVPFKSVTYLILI